MSATILIVDDDPNVLELIGARLRREGWNTETCQTGGQTLQLLANPDTVVDAAVIDVRLEQENGLDLCQRLRANRPDIPVVVITAETDGDAAVGALRAGAFDFIRKPINWLELTATLERGLRQRQLQAALHRLPQAPAPAPPAGLLGQSPAMCEVAALVERVAGLDSSILITGENGTGKEMAARALHEFSGRREQPFVAINCAAIPEGLMESELFGHVKGAFTDARTDHKGIFAQAEGGTLFLDEIAEMSPRLQAKLLRVLQERKVRPIGADREFAIDVRLLAATNRNPAQAILAGQLREDLYYRVSVIHIALPPLRARGDDILLLAQHFLGCVATKLRKRVVGFTAGAAEALLRYAWPGNVRELQNSIEHAVALATYDRIRVDDLPERMRGYEGSAGATSARPAEGPTLILEDIERRHIEQVLAQANGNKSEAARLLGVSRRTLHRRFARGAVSPPSRQRGR